LSTAPTNLGPYQVIRSLGVGGMGEVWLAYDPQLDRQVAIKRIRSDAGLDEERRARFQREARVAAGLNHPAIVHVHHLLTEGEADHIVMEYVAGTSLRQHLEAHGPLPLAAGLAIARAVAAGLALAHRRGVVHRDLKTENVLLTGEGEAKITDFGIARRLYPDETAARDTSLTRAGTLLGTYRSMSPEHICGDPVDARSDLFSLGVLLYEIFTGKSPFLAATNQETMQRVLRHQPPPVHELAAGLPPELADLVGQLLEKNPPLRPRDAEEVVERLDALAGSAIVAGATTLVGVVPPSLAGEALGAAAGRPALRPFVLAAVVLLGLGALSWLLHDAVGSPEPLYVAVTQPVTGNTGDEAAELLAFAIRNALTRTLVSFEGVAARNAPEGDAASTSPAELARAAGADEVLVSQFACRARSCLVELSRVALQGHLLWSDQVTVPLDEPLLAAKSIGILLASAYPGLARRPGWDEPEVEPADYKAFLDVRRTFHAGVAGAGLAELIERTKAIRRSSERFAEAYLLEAQIALRLFHATREQGPLDHALTLIETARQLSPADPDVLSNRAHFELIAGRLDAAEATLVELGRLVPGDVDILAMRARLARDRGKPQEAMALYRTAIERRPSAGLWIDYGRLAFQQGVTATASEAVRQHLDLVPGSLAGRRLAATIEMYHGDPRRAVEILEELAARFSDSIDLSNLGTTLLLLGDSDQAAAVFERALEAAPNHGTVIVNLADCRLLQGRTADAESLYRRAIELLDAEESPTASQLSLRAQALVHLGEAREAVETIKEALRQPDGRLLAYDAAVVYALVGDRTSALVHVGEAVDLGYRARWFDLPWFDDLRDDPEIRELLGESDVP
jgi:serine/threonine-protein kinase